MSNDNRQQHGRQGGVMQGNDRDAARAITQQLYDLFRIPHNAIAVAINLESITSGKWPRVYVTARGVDPTKIRTDLYEIKPVEGKE